jgi:long-chain fatty acid transport protein
LSVTELDWQNVLNYRAGAEYQGLEDMILRFGVAYDPTPAPDATLSPMLPDSDRMMGSMGMTYSMGNYAVDLSYTFIQFLERTIDDTTDNPLRGTYSTSAHIGGLNLRYLR